MWWVNAHNITFSPVGKEVLSNVGPLKRILKPTGADKGADGETAVDDSARAQLKTEIALSDILLSVSLPSILSFMHIVGVTVLLCVICPASIKIYTSKAALA